MQLRGESSSSKSSSLSSRLLFTILLVYSQESAGAQTLHYIVIFGNMNGH